MIRLFETVLVLTVESRFVLGRVRDVGIWLLWKFRAGF